MKTKAHVFLLGRLGNQMFQYSFAYVLLARGFVDEIIVHFQNGSYDSSVVGFNSIFKFDKKTKFNITVLKFADLLWIVTKIIYLKIFRHENIGSYLINNPVDSANHGFIHQIDRLKSLDLPLKHRDYYLEGYFEIPSFFKDYLEELRNIFVINSISLHNKEFYEIITQKLSICISVRRGDFITVKRHEAIYNVCDKNYFQRAIGIMKNKLGKDIALIFFSDDIEWCKNEFGNYDNVFFESGNDSVYEKLKLMSSCRHFIISNSTFSWWAQALSNKEDKIVIAPKTWRKDKFDNSLNDPKWITI